MHPLQERENLQVKFLSDAQVELGLIGLDSVIEKIA